MKKLTKPYSMRELFLHDLGKVLELSGPVATTYTLAGNLIGHIVLVDEEIVKACAALKIELEGEDAILLRHMILAHHGLLEYGSPVQPHLLEADILHQLDNLDASIQMLKEKFSPYRARKFFRADLLGWRGVISISLNKNSCLIGSLWFCSYDENYRSESGFYVA